MERVGNNKGEFVDYRNVLRSLVRIPSVYPNESEIGSWLVNFLSERRFAVTTQIIDNAKGRLNIFAEKGAGKPTILFYGHMDTVPLVNKKDWSVDPFELTENSGRMYGLGAGDMKGGIAAFLDASQRTNAHVKIFLASDEENISEGAWKAIGANRVFFNCVDLVISAEPGLGFGVNEVAVGRTGRAVYEVKFIGKPEHILRYRDAVDAIMKLSEFSVELYASRDKMFDSKDTVVQLRKIEGESVGMSVCGNASAEVEAIIGAEDSIESVMRRLSIMLDAKLDSINIKRRKTPYLESYSFDNVPYMDIISGVIRESTGRTLSTVIRKSVGDDNVIATLGIPVITWGPEGTGHVADEYVDADSLSKITNMYLTFLERVRR